MGLKQKMKKSLLAIDINFLLDSDRMKKRARREVVRSRYEDDVQKEVSFSGNKARSRFGECLQFKENKRGGEIKTYTAAPVPQILESQKLCYLT